LDKGIMPAPSRWRGLNGAGLTAAAMQDSWLVNARKARSPPAQPAREAAGHCDVIRSNVIILNFR
jgi:hypothetical protein